MHSIKTLTRITAIFAVTLLVSLPFMANAQDTNDNKLEMYEYLASLKAADVGPEYLSGNPSVDNVIKLVFRSCRNATLHIIANRLYNDETTVEQVKDQYEAITYECLEVYHIVLEMWRRHAIEQSRRETLSF